MKIIFHKISWKNLLSTGNHFTEIELDKNTNTLIIGTNGAGKSTFLDALTFNLFGKPFRKTNKPTIVNWINQSDCMTKSKFTIGSKKYEVNRGISPNVFEIYENGVLIDQNRDYQKHLEENILHMNFKTFTQIVVLGNGTFVPFMQLTAAERRSFIEDLLDIKIFSVMSGTTKSLISTNKDSIGVITRKMEIISSKIGVHQKHIDDYTKNNDLKITSNKEELEKLEKSTLEHTTELNDLLSKIQVLENQSKFDNDKLSKFYELKTKISHNLNLSKKDLDLYNQHDDCPTCKQTIAPEFKCEKVRILGGQILDFQEATTTIQNKIQTMEQQRKTYFDNVNKINELKSNIKEKEFWIKANKEWIEKYTTENETLLNSSINLEQENLELQKLNEELTLHTNTHDTLLLEKRLLTKSAMILKDDGIKVEIIKQYLPTINQLINENLSKMDFFVSFYLNESFDECIMGRSLKEASYWNFSEGEKLRLDLALLFSWISIAKLKNSIDTNILIMDEILDRSLDQAGTEECLSFVQSYNKESNIFVLSPKGDVYRDKFSNVIEFKKVGGFSEVV